MDVLFPSIDGRSSLTFQVEGVNSWELDAPLALTHGDFAGRSHDELAFSLVDVRRFVAALRAFAEAHEGEARLESVDTYGASLRVFAADRARHAALSVTLRRETPSGDRWYWCQLEVTFELDPSRWDELLGAWQQVLDSALGPVDPQPRP